MTQSTEPGLIGMPMREVPALIGQESGCSTRGAEALSDRELLALLLGGWASPAGTSGNWRVELITRHGGLYALSRVPAHELAASVSGVGQAKARGLRLRFQLGRRAAVQQAPGRRVSGFADLAAVPGPLLSSLRPEREDLVACHGADVVPRTSVLTDSASDRTLVPVRDILARVLALGVPRSASPTITSPAA